MKKHFNYKHGEALNNSHAKLYLVWRAMINRTTKPHLPSYKYYGARGICVCKEWLISSNFFRWAKKNGYKEGLTIDRIDTNGNYEPNNCRWVTTAENNLNKRKKPFRNVYKYDGWFKVYCGYRGKKIWGGEFRLFCEALIARDNLENKLKDNFLKNTL